MQNTLKNVCAQNGRVEYTGAIRHKDHRTCPVGSMALYWFWRFHSSDEEFPDMAQRKNWYDILAFTAGSRTKPMSYNTQYNAFKEAHKSLGIICRKTTHASRPSGSQRLESEE